MFREQYPLVYRHLLLCLIENQLDMEQIQGLVRREKDEYPGMREEVSRVFQDKSISWRTLLNDPTIGEIYPADSEEAAIAYARKLFGI